MREFFYNLRNSEFFQSKKNIIILAVLLVALPVGIFLITQQQIFKSRASGERIEFSGPNVETRDGRKVATKPEVILKLNTTLSQEVPPPTPSSSPAPSSASPAAPSAPTNLSASCPAPGTTTSFSWSGNNNSTTYYELFIDNKVNAWGNYGTGIDSANRINSPTNSFTATSLATNTYGWWMRACNSTGCSSESYGTEFTCTRPALTWSANLLDPANMQNVTVSDPVTQKVQWLGPGIYTFSGAITSNTPKVQGNSTFASLQADEWTDAGAFSGVRSPGTTFTVPSGSKVAVILRAINADAAFANVSLTKEEEGGNIIDPSLVTWSGSATRPVARQDPPLGQKYRLYGSVSGDGSLDVVEWTSSNQWVASYDVNSGPFGITATGNFLQAAYNVTRGATASFSNVRWVGITQSANLVDSDKQNTTVSDPVTQKTQEFGPGTYKLSGDITSNNPVVQGNPTQASIQADEWNQAGTSFVGVHDPESTFTVPSGNKVVVILRTINANATFANVSLQKQQ